MTDIIAVAVSVGSAGATIIAGGMFIGRLRERVEGLVDQGAALRERIDHLEAGQGGGDVTRADMLARLTQVERNTQAVGALGDRVTRLETSTEIHHKAITEKLDGLDRVQQGIHRMVSNWMNMAGGGKFMALPPDTDRSG